MNRIIEVDPRIKNCSLIKARIVSLTNNCPLKTNGRQIGVCQNNFHYFIVNTTESVKRGGHFEAIEKMFSF